MTRAKGDVAGHLATVERLAAAGEETTAARAGLGFAERGLALLRGRQRLLRSGKPSLDEGYGHVELVGGSLARGHARDWPRAVGHHSTITDAARELKSEFALLDDWRDKVEFIIDLGKELLPLPGALKSEGNKGQACRSRPARCRRPHDGAALLEVLRRLAADAANQFLLVKTARSHGPCWLLRAANSFKVGSAVVETESFICNKSGCPEFVRVRRTIRVGNK